LLRTAISIREGKLSSVTLLRRLGNHSRKNRLYRAFTELGRAVRTITLLRFLSEPELPEQITAITNRNESFHGFADWLMFGGKLIGHNDPDYQEKVVKSTSSWPTASCPPLPWTSRTPPMTWPPRAARSTWTGSST
jgi:TnpA family transposase